MSTETGTREHLETLARWMGWEVEVSPEGRASFAWTDTGRTDGFWLWIDNQGSRRWNPWTDANAAEQLMERAKVEGWEVIVDGPLALDGWTASAHFDHAGSRIAIERAATPKEAIASAIYQAVKAQEESHAG